jgi:hypothetical protein
MRRKLLIVSCAVFAAASAGATSPVTAATTAPDRTDDVTVVGEAIIAPTAFELAAGPARTAATAATTTATTTVDPACLDFTYGLAAWRLPSSFTWYYNPAGAPASVASTALAAIRSGSTTMFRAGFRCGSYTPLSISHVYAGSSTRTAQVSSTGTCTGNDNVSVVSWGALPSNILAYTCVYYSTATKKVLASDVLIDNKYHQWFTTLPAGCSNMFDLQSVMLHERGHTAGLAHVDQLLHGVLNMSPKTPPCSTTRRTLGAGEVAGMKAMYGV